MAGQDNQPILATLQFASGDHSLRAFEDDGGITDDSPAQYKAISGIKVHDLRSAGLTYAENGISIIKIDTKMSLGDFTKKEVIESVYLAEVETHLMKAFGAKSIFIFDWVLRNCDASDSSSIPEQGFTPRKPALFAHIDYTSAQVVDRIHSLFGEKASTLLAGRFDVVNVWKPIVGPVRDFPIAYCDPRTLDQDRDLVLYDDGSSDHVCEIYQVLHSMQQRWYYLPDQQATEVVVFNGYDSQSHQSRAVAHTAFSIRPDGSVPPRRSIEIRAFVFFNEA
jgi:hypothetical protein